MRDTGHARRASLRAGAALIVALGLLGAALPPTHRADGQAVAAFPVSPTTGRPQAHGPVYSITLPQAWPAVPDGPNRAQFEALCRLCHSPRLVLTQPRLPEKKWGEVVHKMVAVYGAPIPPEQEQAIVAYLTAVHGAGQQP